LYDVSFKTNYRQLWTEVSLWFYMIWRSTPTMPVKRVLTGFRSSFELRLSPAICSNETLFWSVEMPTGAAATRNALQLLPGWYDTGWPVYVLFSQLHPRSNGKSCRLKKFWTVLYSGLQCPIPRRFGGAYCLHLLQMVRFYCHLSRGCARKRRGLIYGTTRYQPESTEENHQKPQAEYSVSGPWLDTGPPEHKSASVSRVEVCQM
jgi:hypothetical protein